MERQPEVGSSQISSQDLHNLIRLKPPGANMTKEEAVVGTLLSTLQQNPAYLLHMPRVLLPEPGGTTAAEKWFRSVGIDPRAVATHDFRSVRLREIGDFADPSFSYWQREGNFSLTGFLEDLRREYMKSIFTDRVTAKTRELMSAAIPTGLIPQENTEVLVQFVSRETKGLNPGGSYCGRVKGKHYILLEISVADEIHPEPDAIAEDAAIITLSHELTHQRTVEMHGTEIVFGVNLDTVATEETIQRILARGGRGELAVTLRGTLNGPLKRALRQDGEKGRPLILAAEEGLALWVEQQVVQARKREILATNDSQEQAIAIARISAINHERETMFDEFVKHRPKGQRKETVRPYIRGVQLMKRLLNLFSADELATLWQAIDYQALRRVPLESSEARRIYHNPRLLPGLETLPIVWQSYNRNS